MNKLKLLYSILVIAVVVLIAFAGYSVLHQSISSQDEPATITSQAIIDVEKYSIFHLEISNREGHDINYKICILFDNLTRCFWQQIRDEKMFTYKRYFRPEENREKELTILIYREAESEPIENATYYV